VIFCSLLVPSLPLILAELVVHVLGDLVSDGDKFLPYDSAIQMYDFCLDLLALSFSPSVDCRSKTRFADIPKTSQSNEESAVRIFGA